MFVNVMDEIMIQFDWMNETNTIPTNSIDEGKEELDDQRNSNEKLWIFTYLNTKNKHLQKKV